MAHDASSLLGSHQVMTEQAPRLLPITNSTCYSEIDDIDIEIALTSYSLKVCTPIFKWSLRRQEVHSAVKGTKPHAARGRSPHPHHQKPGHHREYLRGTMQATKINKRKRKLQVPNKLRSCDLSICLLSWRWTCLTSGLASHEMIGFIPYCLSGPCIGLDM